MLKKIATLTKPVSTKPKNNLKAAVASGSGDQAETNDWVSEDAIRRRAYQKWEAAGNPAGDGVRFWWEAEQEVLQGK
jgi:hypothetical protein